MGISGQQCYTQIDYWSFIYSAFESTMTALLFIYEITHFHPIIVALEWSDLTCKKAKLNKRYGVYINLIQGIKQSTL